MIIGLADDIWTRLYGPYGNRSVNTQLATLSQKWDIGVARDLFWEGLHHQDDIYPATFGALPWLVKLAPSEREAFEETYLFLSHVIHCARAQDGVRLAGTYRGLSGDITDHQHSWIPQDEWLTLKDLPILTSLEQWFSESWPVIAQRCLSLVGSDLAVSAYAIEGFASAHGGERVAWSAQMFANGESVDFISGELGVYDEGDTLTVAKLFPYLHDRNPELAAFILDYPGCSFVPNDARQSHLL